MQETQGREVTDARVAKIMADAAEFFEEYLWSSENCRSAREWLDEQGLKKKTLQEFGVGYAPVGHGDLMEHLSDLGYTPEEVEESGLARLSARGRVHAHFRSRITFPVKDRKGRVLGFAGLSTHLGPSWPLWVVSPDDGLYHREHAIFGLDRAAKQIKTSKAALVLRDCVDVVRAHQEGKRNAVAVHTGSITHDQLEELAIGVPRGLDGLELDLAPGMAVEPEPDPAAAKPEVVRIPSPEDTYVAPSHLELKKTLVVSATAVAAMNTWTGAPLIALWIGSHAQGGNVLSLWGVVTVLVVMSVLVGLLAWSMMWLSNKYDRLTGRPAIAGQTSPWHRAKRGDRVQDIRSRYGISAPEKAVVIAVAAGVIALEVWFFLYAEAPF